MFYPYLMHRSISTAEKQKMLEGAGESWPVCECHGLPKVWQAQQKKSGGSWALRCTKRAKDERNRNTPGRYRYNEVHGIGEPAAHHNNHVSIHKLNKTIAKYQNLMSLDKNDPEYMRIVRGGNING